MSTRTVLLVQQVMCLQERKNKGWELHWEGAPTGITGALRILSLYLDWNYDEDRYCIRSQHGSENISRLRHFAIGVIKIISTQGRE